MENSSLLPTYRCNVQYDKDLTDFYERLEESYAVNQVVTKEVNNEIAPSSAIPVQPPILDQIGEESLDISITSDRSLERLLEAPSVINTSPVYVPANEPFPIPNYYEGYDFSFTTAVPVFSNDVTVPSNALNNLEASHFAQSDTCDFPMQQLEDNMYQLQHAQGYDQNINFSSTINITDPYQQMEFPMFGHVLENQATAPENERVFHAVQFVGQPRTDQQIDPDSQHFSPLCVNCGNHPNFIQNQNVPLNINCENNQWNAGPGFVTQNDYQSFNFFSMKLGTRDYKKVLKVMIDHLHLPASSPKVFNWMLGRRIFEMDYYSSTPEVIIVYRNLSTCELTIDLCQEVESSTIFDEPKLHENLPTINKRLKTYFLQFVDARDLLLEPCFAREVIRKRIVDRVGKKVKPRMISSFFLILKNNLVANKWICSLTVTHQTNQQYANTEQPTTSSMYFSN